MKTQKIVIALLATLALSAASVPLALACGTATGNRAGAAAPTGHAPKPPGIKPAPAPDNAPAPSRGGAASETPSQTTDENGYTIAITGGYDTDPLDHGRPVVLIAAALGVPTEVFRQAFSGVTPAGAGSSGPTQEEAQANKAALMKVLAPYGITNDRLDEVSNYYRYSGVKGEVWQRTPAKLATKVTNGALTGVTIVDPGSGYSSAPTVTITGPDGKKLTATTTISYGKDFKTNGSISKVTISK